MGAVAGGLFGLAWGLWSQIQPRIAPYPGTIFSGAPQGQDQWVYFAMVQAIWRTGNGFTYSYPFDLFWPTPAVVFQLPLAFLSWIARVTGLPAAFEVARVAGAAGTGAALAVLARILCPGWRRRRWLLATLALGGGWFWMRSVAIALRVAGPDGLTDLPFYQPLAMGGLYSWTPFVTQNVVYPLEAVYHGLVLGALAALLCGRDRLALLLGLATWFSNPFPAVALSMAVVPWCLCRMVVPENTEARAAARRRATAWLVVSLAGASYYGLFVRLWPALRDLSSQYAHALQPPLNLAEMALMWGPWIAGLAWSAGWPAGRRMVWAHRKWSLFAWLAVTQVALVQHGWLMGQRALQPHHFNRGYMLVGFALVFWRWATTVAGPSRKLPRWLLVWIALTLPDQGFFFVRTLSEGVRVGSVSHDAADVAAYLRRYPGGLVFLAEDQVGCYLAAVTNQIPYRIPESMVVPFPERREAMLVEAVRRGAALETLRIDLLVATARMSVLAPHVQKTGWRRVFANRSLVVYERPGLKGTPGPVPGQSIPRPGR